MLINLTPHTITLNVDGTTVRIPQGGRPARCESATHTETLDVDGVSIPLVRHSPATVRNLPDAAPGTLYIVSRMVAAALRGIRDDLLVVHDLVIDDTRHVRGCRALMAVG